MSSLNPLFPVSGPALVVSYRDYVHKRGFVKINDCEREATQKKAAGSMQMFRPAIRRAGDGSNGFRYCQSEVDGYAGISLPVPCDRSSEFFSGVRMKPEWFTHLPEILWPNRGVLPRPVSFELCPSARRQRGA